MFDHILFCNFAVSFLHARSTHANTGCASYLDVSTVFCFPGITLGTASPGLLSKYPGRAPKGALFLWHPWGFFLGGGEFTHRGSFSSRGFSFIGCPTRAHCSVLYSDTLSVRNVGCVCVIPCPASLLTARVLVNGGSAPPWVSTYPLSSLVSRHPGLRVSSCTGSPQHSPALWLRLTPLATPRCFPI